MTTKEQERKALERIRKIVEEMGENSYIATAFEGCFEIAEENIENDFACSMKQRVESAEQTAAEFKRAAEYYSAEADKNAAMLGTLRAELEAAKAKMLSSDDLEDLRQLASDRRSEYEVHMKDAAERIVELAGNPDTAEFRQAVNEHRIARSSMEYTNDLIGRVMHAQGARA